ncbi:MAG: PD40 domain-containing protein [Saprospiraceae bacterium]|nr:PD40 domain-containing protein [Saprospiraceae bacterium]
MARIYIALLGLLFFTSCKVTQYDYAFISDRDGNLDLYISSANDQLLNVTNDKFADYGIKWSPDRNFVLFAKQVNKQYDLYLYNVALKTTAQLTNDTFDQYGPSFFSRW